MPNTCLFGPVRARGAINFLGNRDHTVLMPGYAPVVGALFVEQDGPGGKGVGHEIRHRPRNWAIAPE